MLESYEAYSDYKQGMKFTEQLIKFVVEGVYKAQSTHLKKKKLTLGLSGNALSLTRC